MKKVFKILFNILFETSTFFIVHRNTETFHTIFTGFYLQILILSGQLTKNTLKIIKWNKWMQQNFLRIINNKLVWVSYTFIFARYVANLSTWEMLKHKQYGNEMNNIVFILDMLRAWSVNYCVENKHG